MRSTVCHIAVLCATLCVPLAASAEKHETAVQTARDLLGYRSELTFAYLGACSQLFNGQYSQVQRELQTKLDAIIVAADYPLAERKPVLLARYAATARLVLGPLEDDVIAARKDCETSHLPNARQLSGEFSKYVASLPKN